MQELERINNAREVLDYALSVGLITQKDIYNILKNNCDYIFTKTNGYKDKLLKQIISSPFVLCDQDSLDLHVKKILPTILSIRSSVEINELEMMQELGLIDEHELKDELKMIKYNYYLSSIEGRQILKYGHIKNVKDNVLRK